MRGVSVALLLFMSSLFPIAAAVDAKLTMEAEADPLADAMSGVGQNILTATSLRRMAKDFAGIPVTDAAIHELLELCPGCAASIRCGGFGYC